MLSESGNFTYHRDIFLDHIWSFYFTYPLDISGFNHVCPEKFFMTPLGGSDNSAKTAEPRQNRRSRVFRRGCLHRQNQPQKLLFVPCVAIASPNYFSF